MDLGHGCSSYFALVVDDAVLYLGGCIVSFLFVLCVLFDGLVDPLRL